jgi:hypothetical protein
MTRREIHERLEMQARRRAAQAMETHRPWLCDSQPDGLEEEDGGPQMLAYALLYCAVVVGLLVLGTWAWSREDGWQQRAYCAQLQMAQAPSMPDYCNGEGK